MLYHGTRRPFRKGGLLVPRSSHGGAGTAAPTLRAQPEDAYQWCYGTEDVVVAWAYAWVAPGRGAPRVLVLRPYDAPVPDPEHSPAMRAWRFRMASVAEVLTSSPITEREAREGWDLAD